MTNVHAFVLLILFYTMMKKKRHAILSHFHALFMAEPFFNEEEDVMVLIKLTWCPPWIVFLPQRFVLKEFYAFSSEYQLVINQIRNIKRLIFTLRKAHVSHANSGRNY